MRKFWYIAPFLLACGYFLFVSFKPATTKPNQARLILSELRGGDFTHAGDIEAIDMVITKMKRDFPEFTKGNCLDVGCGFGGTASYLKKNGFEHIWAIDVDKSAIDYAKSKYKDVNFLNLDALLANSKFEKDFFSFIYLFNVLYAVEDKPAALEQLAAISKPGAILMIFDYSVANANEPMLDLVGKTIRPVCMKKIKQQLQESGWEVLEITDISSKFIIWYEQLIKKLEEKKHGLKEHFLEEDIAKVSSTYVHILHHLRHKTLGGVIIYAKHV